MISIHLWIYFTSPCYIDRGGRVRLMIPRVTARIKMCNSKRCSNYTFLNLTRLLMKTFLLASMRQATVNASDIRSHRCSSRPCTRCVINYCATSLIVFISSFQIMSNLWYIELLLGSLYSWPQDILRYLFLDIPTPYTTLRLAAFLFGNGIE